MAIKEKTSARKKSNHKPFLVKVNPDILEKVKKFLEPTGAQIGKFYDSAASEKLEAENKAAKK